MQQKEQEKQTDKIYVKTEQPTGQKEGAVQRWKGWLRQVGVVQQVQSVQIKQLSCLCSEFYSLIHKYIRVLRVFSGQVALIIPSGVYTEVAEGTGRDAENHLGGHEWHFR